MPRIVTLDLVDSHGGRLGSLPAFEIDSPWWQDTAPAVQRAAELYGVDARILHLLDGSADGTMSPTAGGSARYLAELISGPAPGPIGGGPEPEEPLRPLWARPGGTARIVEWAEAVLRSLGRAQIGDAQQFRAWNLSSILRIDTATGPVWCKSVPAFFAHEGPAIEWLSAIAPAGLLPTLLGHDPATTSVLLDDIPGADLYDCDEKTMLAMIERLIDLQFRTIGRAAEMHAIGAPNWQPDNFIAAIRGLWAKADLPVDEMTALDRLISGLPRRFAVLAECGLPDTLVHGDPHPGNWRSDGTSLVLLDWGDCGFGHPMLDTVALVERVDDDGLRQRLLDAFVAGWRDLLPAADPTAALRIIEPIAALRQALIYQTFLDGIEPAERVYHRADVPNWLRNAIGLAARS